MPQRRDLYFLKTARLGFRVWREDDQELALDLWGDPLVMSMIDSRGGLSPDQTRIKLADEIEMEKKSGVQYWPTFLLADTRNVGCCGLRPHDKPNGIFEIGVHIKSLFWRQGLAEEAVRGVIDYAFEALKATGLFAGHNPGNSASRQLLQKIGFRHTHDEFYPPTGLMHPSYILEASKWRQRKE